jgi:hypothetical protein
MEVMEHEGLESEDLGGIESVTLTYLYLSPPISSLTPPCLSDSKRVEWS